VSAGLFIFCFLLLFCCGMTGLTLHHHLSLSRPSPSSLNAEVIFFFYFCCAGWRRPKTITATTAEHVDGECVVYAADLLLFFLGTFSTYPFCELLCVVSALLRGCCDGAYSGPPRLSGNGVRGRVAATPAPYRCSPCIGSCLFFFDAVSARVFFFE
jgi:hypothetical protein